MSKKRKYKPHRSKCNPKKLFQPAPTTPVVVHHLLEQGTLQDMRKAKEKMALNLKYSWDYYSELALQRSQIQEELKKALIGSCISKYQFSKWQRAVKWKYGLHPLSTVGSLTFVGQRFNTGSDVSSEVPSFPALYLAVDKDTALQETLGQTQQKGSQLSARELALTNAQSEVIVSVSGELEKIFDLRTADALNDFVDLIKGFTLSAALKKTAKELELDEPTIVQNAKQLLESLLVENWRGVPSGFDVPANSQIFGHLVYNAGIEGILYPSKLTKKDCLAIFPHNFQQSSSFVALDDDAPDASVPKRIDSNSWRDCDLSADEIRERSTGTPKDIATEQK